MPRLTGYLQPRRNWPTWASSVLITHPILRIWPHRTTTCSLDWKNNWKFTIFRPTRRSLLPRRPGWTDNLLIFFSALQKLEQRAKKCEELRGEYVEYIPSLVAVACFLPGRAKDLSVPRRMYVYVCMCVCMYTHMYARRARARVCVSEVCGIFVYLYSTYTSIQPFLSFIRTRNVAPFAVNYKHEWVGRIMKSVFSSSCLKQIIPYKARCVYVFVHLLRLLFP